MIVRGRKSSLKRKSTRLSKIFVVTSQIFQAFVISYKLYCSTYNSTYARCQYVSFLKVSLKSQDIISHVLTVHIKLLYIQFQFLEISYVVLVVKYTHRCWYSKVYFASEMSFDLSLQCTRISI